MQVGIKVKIRTDRAARAVVLLCASWIAAAVALAQNPVPQIVGPVEPDAVAPGSGAFSLNVYGANFVPGAVVNWNRQPRTTTFVSAHQTTCVSSVPLTNPTTSPWALWQHWTKEQ
jgi:hypothetical protein